MVMPIKERREKDRERQRKYRERKLAEGDKVYSISLDSEWQGKFEKYREPGYTHSETLKAVFGQLDYLSKLAADREATLQQVEKGARKLIEKINELKKENAALRKINAEMD